ncbi:hypothetical protein F5887DRAFT_1137796 [Amanita rubescens]|nr:hypothetical protein F5887DRAFT_1137796 [Amanita rubescens]
MEMVIVRDFDGNTLFKFWQYGLIDWELLYECLRKIILSDRDWEVFEYDEYEPTRRGAHCLPSREIPLPGTYILLQPDGSPIHIDLTPNSTRVRHPVPLREDSDISTFQQHVRDRDTCCLICGLEVEERLFVRFRETHIFPPAHESEWIDKGFPNLITDTAPLSELGGASKIDSVQNGILLRSDLHNAWSDYLIAVLPDRGHVVVPVVGGYDDVAGKTLKLDHITDPNLRPLDELFRDHFLQCVLRRMKGEGEPSWDYEEAFDDDVDLSKDIWSGKQGKELEL